MSRQRKGGKSWTKTVRPGQPREQEFTASDLNAINKKIEELYIQLPKIFMEESGIRAVIDQPVFTDEARSKIEQSVAEVIQSAIELVTHGRTMKSLIEQNHALTDTELPSNIVELEQRITGDDLASHFNAVRETLFDEKYSDKLEKITREELTEILHFAQELISNKTINPSPSSQPPLPD